MTSTDCIRPWYVYLLTCADDTLYCGVTTDLARRLAEHNSGSGAKYTRSRRPVCLAACASFADQGSALRAEAAVKRRPKDRKLAYLRSLAQPADDSLLGFSRCPGQSPAPAEHPCLPDSPRKIMHDLEQYQGKISKEEIGELPLGNWRGETVLITDEPAAQAAVAAMRREKVLGFDTESRPAFRKGKYYLPSLIQVATFETVYIFLLGKFPFPDCLKTVFEDPNIIKSGVAVRDDVKDLMKVSHFEPRGFIDLGVVALNLKLDTHGLRNLAAKFLGIRISKSARCTNWANPRLTPAQINYAATDAWISRELFLAMDREGLIDPATDLENGNGAPERKQASKSRARIRRGKRRPASADSDSDSVPSE